MDRRLLSVAAVVAAVLLAAGHAAARQDSLSKAEREVRKLEREWLDAYEQNDAAAMDRIVAEDFIITFPNGSVQTKAQLMAMIRAPRKGAPPKFYTEEVKSRAYGDTVILTGRVVGEFQQGGKAVRDVSRYTDTYVKVGGRWRVVASHLSAAEAPRPSTP